MRRLNPANQRLGAFQNGGMKSRILNCCHNLDDNLLSLRTTHYPRPRPKVFKIHASTCISYSSSHSPASSSPYQHHTPQNSHKRATTFLPSHPPKLLRWQEG